MRKKLDGAPEALLRALGVAVEIGILSIVPAAGMVLNSLQLTVGLCLDVLIEDVVFGKLPQDALLPFVCRKLVHAAVVAPRSFLTFILLAANLAQEHAPQLLTPILVLGVVLFDQAVEVALALVIGRRVKLLFGRSISEGSAFEVNNVLTVGFGGKDRPKGRHGLLGHTRRR